MKTLFVTSESYPYAVSGGLGDYSYALPKALRKNGVSCRVVMPYYSRIAEKYGDKVSFINNISVPVSWRRQYCGIFTTTINGVIYYFIDNEYYFKRPELYGYNDDIERFTFFARAVLEILPVIEFFPDILHCNDWQSAMVPVFKDVFYSDNEKYNAVKTLTVIHNIQYQGNCSGDYLGDIFGIDEKYRSLVDYNGEINMLKGGIETANTVCTVSRTYAKELLDPWYSCGMDAILNERSYKLAGIVNGIDYDVYNPETDEFIYENYSSSSLKIKAQNKAALLNELGLDSSEDVPLIGMVSRLVSHKGFDLVKYAFDSIMENSVKMVILGSGEWEFESFFDEMSVKYPDKFVFKKGFIPELAHKIYAGSDIFLMPSKSEPCGLAQMVALRYGTIPVVRQTGGLKDTVTDVDDKSSEYGNGYSFKNYNAGDMCGALFRAVGGYYDKDFWSKLRLNAMQCDCSWNVSAKEYLSLYRDITNK